MQHRKYNVKTVQGLQALLAEAVSDLVRIEKRDLHTVRTQIAAVNAGNALLRTDQMARPRATNGRKKAR